MLWLCVRVCELSLYIFLLYEFFARIHRASTPWFHTFIQLRFHYFIETTVTHRLRQLKFINTSYYDLVKMSLARETFTV